MSSIGFRMGFTGRAVLAGGVLGMGFMAVPAQATVYDWTWQDDGGLGGSTSSGQFEEIGGVIQWFSGTWYGVTIDGLIGPNGFDSNDNAFPLTANGVAFALLGPLSNGQDTVRLTDFGYWTTPDQGLEGYGSFTATAVPEPASAALLGTALVGLLAGARRRRVKADAAA